MCGRFDSFHGPAAICDAFRTVGDILNVAPSWNVALTQAAMVVRRRLESSERDLALLRWGVEPVFGPIKQARGFRQLLLRSIEKVRGEWAMICAAHNLANLNA